MDVNVTELAVWQKWTLIAGKSALTLLTASQLASATWLVVAPDPVVLKAPSKGQQVQISDDTAGTADYHLFGIASNARAPKPQVREVEAPVTRLRLELMGVTQSSAPDLSSAIIAQKGKPGEFFRVGDTVQGRTVLQAVYADRVMLDTSGKLEVLKFEERKSSGANVSRTSRNDSRRQRDNNRSARNRGSLKDRFSNVRSASEAVDVVTSEVSDDPQKALDRMGLEPQGTGSGYRVSARSPLKQFKLRPGDIVLSLNGQTLGDPAADRSLLTSLDSADEVRIEVQRGNSRFTVNHRLD